MSNPKAEIQITAESRTLGAKLRDARAQLGKFGGELKKEVFGKKLVEKGFLGEAGAHMVGGLGASAASRSPCRQARRTARQAAERSGAPG
jgi:hypothetical protein